MKDELNRGSWICPKSDCFLNFTQLRVNLAIKSKKIGIRNLFFIGCFFYLNSLATFSTQYCYNPRLLLYVSRIKPRFRTTISIHTMASKMAIGPKIVRKKTGLESVQKLYAYKALTVAGWCCLLLINSLAFELLEAPLLSFETTHFSRKCTSFPKRSKTSSKSQLPSSSARFRLMVTHNSFHHQYWRDKSSITGGRCSDASETPYHYFRLIIKGLQTFQAFERNSRSAT